jgi:hypothetical protein
MWHGFILHTESFLFAFRRDADALSSSGNSQSLKANNKNIIHKIKKTEIRPWLLPFLEVACNCNFILIHPSEFGNPPRAVRWGEVTLRLAVSQCLGIGHTCGTCDQILLPVGMLLSEICGLVSTGRPLWREDGKRRRLIYDWQSASQYVLVPSNFVGLATRYYFLSECCCLKFAVLFLWGALSDDRTGLQFAVQSRNGASRSEPVTILYCLNWDPPNLEGLDPVFTRLVHKVRFPGAVYRNKTQFHGNIYCNRYSKCSAIFQHNHHRKWDICHTVGPTFEYLCRRTLPPGIGTRGRFPYVYPPGTGWPCYIPGNWVPFKSFLRLAGLGRRYSNTPPTRRAWIPYI